MKPFIKWAGGKNLVLGSLQKFFPSKQHSFNYAEPFLGGGAIFFYLANNFSLQKVVLNDISPKLIATYLAVQKYYNELIILLNSTETSKKNQLMKISSKSSLLDRKKID